MIGCSEKRNRHLAFELFLLLFTGRWAYNWGEGGLLLSGGRGTVYKRTFTAWFM